MIVIILIVFFSVKMNKVKFQSASQCTPDISFFFIISGQPEPNQTFKNDRPSHTMMMMKNHFIDPCDHMMMIFIFHNLKICVDLGQHKTKPNKQTDKFLFSPHYCPVEQNIVHWTFFLGLLIHCCGVEEFFIFFFHF